MAISRRTPNTYSPEEVRRALARLRVDSDAQSDNIAAIEVDIAAVEADVTAIDGRLTEAEGDIDGLEGDVAAIDGRISAVEASVNALSMVNGNAGALPIGTPVYCSAAGTVDAAKADALATAEVLGLVQPLQIASAAPGVIQTGGVLTATTGQWDALTGGSGGLTAGAVYWLDPTTAGMLTATAPETVGQYVARIGRALSATKLEINTAPPIGL